MARRPRGALPGWAPRTARQRAILADLVARYEQHSEEQNERERLPGAIRHAIGAGIL